MAEAKYIEVKREEYKSQNIPLLGEFGKEYTCKDYFMGYLPSISKENELAALKYIKKLVDHSLK